MSDDDQHVPGTGIMGDETLVREVPGGLHLPTPAVSPGHTNQVHPGPTPPSAIKHADNAGEMTRQRVPEK
jgi:hypothetical protein